MVEFRKSTAKAVGAFLESAKGIMIFVFHLGRRSAVGHLVSAPFERFNSYGPTHGKTFWEWLRDPFARSKMVVAFKRRGFTVDPEGALRTKSRRTPAGRLSPLWLYKLMMEQLCHEYSGRVWTRKTRVENCFRLRRKGLRKGSLLGGLRLCKADGGRGESNFGTSAGNRRGTQRTGVNVDDAVAMMLHPWRGRGERRCEKCNGGFREFAVRVRGPSLRCFDRSFAGTVASGIFPESGGGGDPIVLVGDAGRIAAAGISAGSR